MCLFVIIKCGGNCQCTNVQMWTNEQDGTVHSGICGYVSFMKNKYTLVHCSKFIMSHLTCEHISCICYIYVSEQCCLPFTIASIAPSQTTTTTPSASITPMPPKAIKSWSKADNGALANLICKQGLVAIEDHSIADIETVHIEIFLYRDVRKFLCNLRDLLKAFELMVEYSDSRPRKKGEEAVC